MISILFVQPGLAELTSNKSVHHKLQKGTGIDIYDTYQNPIENAINWDIHLFMLSGNQPKSAQKSQSGNDFKSLWFNNLQTKLNNLYLCLTPIDIPNKLILRRYKI